MPMDRSKYPDNWEEMARRIKNRAKWRCEQCKLVHNPNSASTTLTVHHKDGDPSNCADDNLIALCAPCHLRAQRTTHLYEARQTKLEF